MTVSHLASVRPLTEVQAFAWLQAQGRVTVTAAELGRRWGWHRQRVGRRLRSWHSKGEIQWFEAEKTIVTPVTPVTVTGAPPLQHHSEPVTPTCDSKTPVTPPEVTVVTAPVGPSHGKLQHRILGAVLILCGLGTGILSLYVNATGWSSFAKSASAGVTLAGLGFMFDILALTLPAAASVSQWRYAVALRASWVVIAGPVS